VRNLFDERYPVRGFYFGNEPPDFPTRLYLRWGDPRQAGITARYSF
jgi:outer membrane receptor protein involved in Fe transport